jgi:Domain of Unknown Function (DUF748)
MTASKFKKSRWFKPLIWTASLYLAYVLIGFFVVPPVLKSQLLKRLPVLTKRRAEVRQVRFNPLVLSLTVRGLSLNEPDGKVFASWEEFYANFQLSSIFHWAWTFDEIGLKQPYGHVLLDREGRFNFANMLEKETPAAPEPPPNAPAGIPALLVRHLYIAEGVVSLDDLTHRVPLHSEVKPINIALTNLTTRPNKDSVYTIEASSDAGRSFSWSGHVIVDPFQVEGTFDLKGGDLVKTTPVLRDFARAEIAGGRLNLRADYRLAVSTNGFAASLTNGAVELLDFQARDLNAGETVTAFQSFTAAPFEFDLLQRRLHVGTIRLDGCSNVVRIEKDGSLNLNRLIELGAAPSTAPTNAPSAEPSAPAKPWIVSLDEFNLEKGAIAFTDLSASAPFATTLGPIQVHLKQFTTRPDADAAYDYKWVTEAGETISGGGTFSIDPIRSAGGVKLEDVEIKKYAPYFQKMIRGQVLGGKLGVAADYRFLAASNAPLLTVSNAGVTLHDFQLKALDTGETVVSIPSFSVEQTRADLSRRQVEVGLVKSSGGSVLARRNQDGSLNLLGLLPPPAETAVPTKEDSKPAIEAATQPWSAQVREIAFTNYQMKVEDRKPAQPALLNLDQLAFDLKGLSTSSNAPVNLSFGVRFNQSGTVRVKGTSTLQPPAAEWDLAVDGLELSPFQPYLSEQVRLALASGKFQTRSHVRYQAPSPGTDGPAVKFTGDAALTELLTKDQVLDKEFVKWEALNARGIDLELQPGRLQVAEIVWRGFNTSVVVGPDGKLNLQSILPERKTKAAPPPEAAPREKAGTAMPLELGALVLENASFHFRDQSIHPECAFVIQQFGGSVKGLSSRPDATAAVDLAGKVNANAPFAVSGKINPLSKDLLLDLVIFFTNTDLTVFTPYMEKYAGYPMNKGRLNMALHYDVRQEQLKADNKIQIGRLTLGPRNNSPDATSLPVKLAIALMKDRKGMIDLDLPLTGRLDDPEFRVMPLVGKAIVNLIAKAATSPFSLLGAAFGGGEELSFVAFEPGRAEIPEAEAKKLDKLIEALYQRPELNLAIEGSVDPPKDRARLAEMRCEAQIVALHQAALKASATNGATATNAQTSALSPTEHDRLLTEWFFRSAETNRALLPETNRLAQVLAEHQRLAEAATNALQKAEFTSPSPPPSVSPAGAEAKPPAKKKRRFYFSSDKGATLLRVRPAHPPTGPPVPETPQEPQPVAPAVPGAEPGEAIPPPPLTPVELAKAVGLTTSEMKKRLLTTIPVTDDDLRDLMQRRAQTVMDYILKPGKIEAERVSLVAPKEGELAASGEIRVNLSLN